MLRTLVHSLRVPVAALALACFFMLAVPGAALAARSGGRIGGSSFRSASSSMHSSYHSVGGFGGSSLSRGRALHAHSGSGVPYSSSLRTSSFFLSPFGFGYGFGAPNLLFSLLPFLVFAAFLVSGALSNSNTGDGDAGGIALGSTDRVAVVRLQVGLLGIARDLQLDLDRIAERADTSSPAGLQRVLQETTLALLRNPEYCVYGDSGGKQCRTVEEAESRFNEVTLDERSKLASETLVNADGRKKRRSSGSMGDGGQNEFIVVTIIACADGPLKLPPIKTLDDLQTALRRLGAVRREAIQAVEVLWTPQEAGDTLTQQELTRAYPKLNSI